MEETQTNINLTNKERNLIIQVLKDYEKNVYSGIDKRENDFIFNLIDKFLI